MKQQAVSITFSLIALGTTLISGCAPDMTDTVQRLSNQYKGREGEKKSKNNPSISNQQKSKDFSFYLTLGNAKYNAGDYYGAISNYSTAIEIKPDHANAYNNRANAKYNLGNRKGACNDFKKASYLGSTKSKEYLNSYRAAWCRMM